MRLSLPEIIGTRDTSRWHTKTHARIQTVAEHSATTALLARWLAPDDLDHVDRADLLELCLVHDAHEGVYGDAPYPTKQAMLAAGIDLDAICSKAFWGSRGVPEGRVSLLVRELADSADKLDAALYSRDWLPAKFAEIAGQAMESARNLPASSREKVRHALYGAGLATIREISA